MLAALSPTLHVLVAPDRLGVLHDVGAALAAWPDAPETWVVLSAPAASDASTGDNAAELETLGIARVAAVFPHAASDSTPTTEVAHALAQRVMDFVNKSR